MNGAAALAAPFPPFCTLPLAPLPAAICFRGFGFLRASPVHACPPAATGWDTGVTVRYCPGRVPSASEGERGLIRRRISGGAATGLDHAKFTTRRDR